MSNLMNKAKDLVGSHEPTSSDIKEDVPNYGTGHIVPASGGFYDAGAEGDSTGGTSSSGAKTASSDASEAGSKHKGDNYDMHNVTGTERTGAEGVKGVESDDSRREEKRETVPQTSGEDVFAKDPVSAGGSTGGVTVNKVQVDSEGAATFDPSVISEDGRDGTLRGLYRGENTRTAQEYGK